MDELGGKTVTELAVDVVRSEDALGQTGPGVRILVRQPRAADDSDRAGPVKVDRPTQTLGSGFEGFAPRDLEKLAALAHERGRDAVLGVDGLVPEAALVAQPSVVDSLAVEADETGDLVGGRLHRDPAPDGSTSCTCSRPGRGPTAGP